jgi:hypothetical protein
MMLVIGAFMIFGVVRLNFQSTSLESEAYMEGNTYVQQSATIARALMDEIQQHKFDAVLNTKRIVYPSDLTSCGSGSGEYYPYFNDMDDFQGKTFTSPAAGSTPITTPSCLWGTEGFTIRCSVYYVDPNNPNQKAYTYTYAKRVDLHISNVYNDYEYTTSWVACY